LRLDSDRGTAIVLLNWTGAPLTSVTVTVPNAPIAARMASIERGALQPATDAAGRLTVTLPLATVDVLMIE
jgi:hypothetical protein